MTDRILEKVSVPDLQIYPYGTRFSAIVIDKKAFLFNFVTNFQCNSMADVVKFCTSDTLVKNLLDNIFSFLYMLKSRLSRLKW